MDDTYRPVKVPTKVKKVRKKRLYQPIWEKIKESFTTGEPVVVECSPQLRKRIKKGVAKEKCELDDWEYTNHTILRSVNIPEGLIFYLESYRMGNIIKRALREEES